VDSGGILQRLKEIEARAARATPGPWKWRDIWAGPPYIELESPEGSVLYPRGGEESDLEVREEDKMFIAHSREDVPWLCRVTRELLARFERLEAVAEAAREYLHDVDALVRNEPTIYQYEPGEDKTWRLRKALAALEVDNERGDLKRLEEIKDYIEVAEELESSLSTLRRGQVWLLTEWRGKPMLIELTSGAEVRVELGKYFDDPWARSWTAVLRYIHPGRDALIIAGFDTVGKAERALLALADEAGAFKIEEEK